MHVLSGDDQRTIRFFDSGDSQWKTAVELPRPFEGRCCEYFILIEGMCARVELQFNVAQAFHNPLAPERFRVTLTF